MECIPSDLHPNCQCWQLPRGSDLGTGVRDYSALGNFRGDSLWIGVGAAVNRAVATALPSMKNLENLALDGYVIPSEILESISKMKQLRRLHISPTRNGNLDFLAKLENLEYLCLEAIPNVTDLAPALRLPQLVSLGLGTRSPTLGAFSSALLPNLRCLTLDGTGETKPARFDTLKPLINVRSLEYLGLWNIRSRGLKLGFLVDLPKLRAVGVVDQKRWDATELKALKDGGIECCSVI